MKIFQSVFSISLIFANSFAMNQNHLDMVDKYGNGPLMIAYNNKSYDVVENLLVNKANPDTTFGNDNKETLLFKACCDNNGEIIKLLLKHKANPNIPYTYRNGFIMPLVKLCRNFSDDVENIKLLLDFKADVNCCNSDKTTPLLTTCEYGKDSTVQLLIENKADLNFRNDRNEAPLLIASKCNKLDIVETLLSMGYKSTDLTLSNQDKETPLSIALKKNVSKEMINILINFPLSLVSIFEKNKTIQSYKGKLVDLYFFLPIEIKKEIAVLMFSFGVNQKAYNIKIAKPLKHIIICFHLMNCAKETEKDTEPEKERKRKIKVIGTLFYPASFENNKNN